MRADKRGIPLQVLVTGAIILSMLVLAVSLRRSGSRASGRSHSRYR